MKKSWIFVTLSTVLVVGIVGVSWAPEAVADDDNKGKGKGGDLELVVLNGYCQSYTTNTYWYLNLQGNTLGIDASQLVYRSESSTSTGRFCLDVGLPGLVAAAQAGGCIAGITNAYDGGSRTQGSLYAVCSVNRNDAIETLVDMVLLIQTADFNQ